MAEVVDVSWENVESVRYPWEEWTDGQTRKIKQGVDFFANSRDNFRISLYTQAKNRGLGVHTTIKGCEADELIFKFYEKN